MTMTAIAAVDDKQRPLASGGHRRQLCGSGNGDRRRRRFVDSGGGGIEPTAPMAASSTVAAVDGGGNDNIFTNSSHNNDRHPCPHRPRPPSDIGRRGGGRAVTRLIRCRHGCHRWCHIYLHSRDDGAKEDDCGNRQGRNTDIHSREDVGHNNPIGVEVTQGQPVQGDNQPAC